MKIENKEEKIQFLEKILKIAKENPVIITDKGRGIFYEDFPAFDEKCLIGVEIDKNDNPYFTINGTYAQNNNMITNPEVLLLAGERYLPRDLNKFKQQFHLYKNKRKNCKIDLLDSFRN
jgi:hypothetical protein